MGNTLGAEKIATQRDNGVWKRKNISYLDWSIFGGVFVWGECVSDVALTLKNYEIP